MSDSLNGVLAGLLRSYQNGDIDAATYEATVAALMNAQTSAPSTKMDVEGSGAAAAAGGVAGGAHSTVIGGDVYGNIYAGEAPADGTEALRIYCRMFVHNHRHLPLRGVDVDASDPQVGAKRIELSRVYISLNTTEFRQAATGKQDRRAESPPIDSSEAIAVFRGEEERVPVSALEAVSLDKNSVLLGDPGSGKSTFVSHLGVCLALHHLHPDERWLDALADWQTPVKPSIPILITMRDFARWASAEKVRADASLVWRYIISRLSAQNLTFAEAPLHDALEAGDALVLFDGLDEIPTTEQRALIERAISAFAGRYDQSKMVATCRTLSYQDPQLQIEGFNQHELAPFDQAQINAFIAAWYAELARIGVVTSDAAKRLNARLQAAVQRPDLRRLAPNPLLLTVMALVHTHKGRLPDARAVLYEDTVDLLLRRWEEIKADGEEENLRLHKLLLEADRTDVDLKQAIWRLAYEAHAVGGASDDESVADIAEFTIIKALAELHPAGSMDSGDTDRGGNAAARRPAHRTRR